MLEALKASAEEHIKTPIDISLKKLAKAPKEGTTMLKLQEKLSSDFWGVTPKVCCVWKQKWLAFTRNEICKPGSSDAALKRWQNLISWLPTLKAFRMPLWVDYTDTIVIWACRIFFHLFLYLKLRQIVSNKNMICMRVFWQRRVNFYSFLLSKAWLFAEGLTCLIVSHVLHV